MSDPTSAKRRLAVTMLAMACLTACGTTVPMSSQVEQQGGQLPDGSSSLGVPTGSGSGNGLGSSSTGGTGPLSPGQTGGASGQPGSSGGSSATTGSTGTGGPRSQAAVAGHGYTATTIRVGFSDSDAGSYASKVGLKGVVTGDTKAQYQALANYINAHGGIAGRRVLLYEYTYQTQQQLDNIDQAGAQACTAWTSDDQVFAVLNSGLSDLESFVSCMAAANTPTIDSWPASGNAVGAKFYNKYPNTLYNPGSFTAEKLAQLYVGMMKRTKYLTGWDTALGQPGNAPVKAGILIEQDPFQLYAGQRVVAELRKAGVTLNDADIIYFGSGASDFSSASSSAVLKFRQDGVTHVVTSGLTFAQTAQSQHYFPRYANLQEPEVVAENYPAQQLAGSVAMGASPAYDTNSAHQPPDNSAQKLCRKIMTDAHQDSSTLLTWALMQAACDEMFTLATALNATGSISVQSLRVGYERAGAVACTFTFTCQQGPLPGGHASAQAIRDMLFNAACTCYLYVDNVNHRQ
jgi:hypothetical protein